MIKNIIFSINGVDLAPYLATYTVGKAIEYGDIITTIDGTEHALNQKIKVEIQFTFRPLSTRELTKFEEAVQGRDFNVRFTNPNHSGGMYEYRMRLVNGFDFAHALNSVDGQMYWTLKTPLRVRQVT